jgi:hypothetical protein
MEMHLNIEIQKVVKVSLAPRESHPKNHKINHIKQPQDIYF